MPRRELPASRGFSRGNAGPPACLLFLAAEAALLVTQCGDGIKAHGAPRGEVAGDCRNNSQKQGQSHKGKWIGSLYTKEEAGKGISKPQGQRETDSHADYRQEHPVSQNKSLDVS